MTKNPVNHGRAKHIVDTAYTTMTHECLLMISLSKVSLVLLSVQYIEG
ncbi:hypothetical protein PC129_g18567 [Phytophthora cactorum]|nr:hypothetical protein PC117_g21446 [Phytophthora cactorum]KAG3013051.1 hypothetical protein PC120_g13490 [Phytophthora cactorum]KAG3061247.1 hypothetical protein PC122_g19718 [Phytophthora cactorum]KAG3210440.1 hypothetical protein PC129_g18567 [Phytophthora cactorum]